MTALYRQRLLGLIRSQRWAALATVGDGSPFASMVAYAFEPEGPAFLLHLSRLAQHTESLLVNGLASLVISEPDPGVGDPQTLERVTVSGPVREIPRDSGQHPTLRARYLERLPTAEPLFEFRDFVLFQLTAEEVRYVGGFAQAHTLLEEEFREVTRTTD